MAQLKQHDCSLLFLGNKDLMEIFKKNLMNFLVRTKQFQNLNFSLEKIVESNLIFRDQPLGSWYHS